MTPTELPTENHEPIDAPLPLAPGTLTSGENPEPGKPIRSRHWLWLSLSLLLLLGLSAYFLWPTITGAKSSTAAAKGAKAGPPPIPVVATRTRKGDIGTYYSGLGAVTPLATVTVRSRVDGQLMSVHYREGDTVQKGFLLVEIDDGPYRRH